MLCMCICNKRKQAYPTMACGCMSYLIYPNNDMWMHAKYNIS